MSQSPVDRILNKSQTLPASGAEAKPTGFASSDPGSSPRMIDFVLKGGSRTSLPYAYLNMIDQPSGSEIKLVFTEHTVSIKGRNLGTLYQHLSAQIVRRVEENMTGFDDAENPSNVESIIIEPRK